MIALAASALHRSFGPEIAVDGIDLTVDHGEIHAIVGLNGAGKTTLMRLLLGMLKVDSGRAHVLACDARTAGSDIWRQVGHLIESPFAYPELTVAENLRSSALLQEVPRSEVEDAVVHTIELFGLEHWKSRRARALSSGNRQRLGLASAFVHDPPILVLDEPANALDPAGVVFIRDLLRERAAAGSAVLVSSHHFDQLARVADTISVMHRGQIVGALDPGGADLEKEFFDLVHSWDVAAGVRT